MSLPTSARSFAPSMSSSYRKSFARKPVMPDIEKTTLQTHQNTAQNDLFSITNETFTPKHNPEIDPQISAWNQQAKFVPFRVRSPVKQIGQPPNLQTKQSLSSDLSGRKEIKSELKAMLRHYEVNRSIIFTEGTSDETVRQLPSEDCWKEVETLDLDKLHMPAPSVQHSMGKKTMILQPFYSMASKKSWNAQKRAKSTSSHQNRSSSNSKISSHKDSLKVNAIAHTTELKFPIISEEIKLQARLSFYRQQASNSK